MAKLRFTILLYPHFSLKCETANLTAHNKISHSWHWQQWYGSNFTKEILWIPMNLISEMKTKTNKLITTPEYQKSHAITNL